MTRRVGRPTTALVLSDDERAYLERQVRRHRVPRSLSDRCRMILRLADGLTSKAVAIDLGIHEHTVGKWRRRFLKDRIEGLPDAPSVGTTPAHRRRAGSTGHRTHPLQHTDRRHPLVHPLHGQGSGPVPHHGPAHLERLRTAAAPL